MEAGDPEVVEETAALGRPEHYLLNNKIFPGSKSEEVKDKVNNEKVVKQFLDVVVCKSVNYRRKICERRRLSCRR